MVSTVSTIRVSGWVKEASGHISPLLDPIAYANDTDSKRRTNYFCQPFSLATSGFARCFILTLGDVDDRVINDFDTASDPGEAERTGPDAFPAANCYRQDRHACLQRHAYGAQLALFHRTVGIATAAFGKKHHGPAFANPLQRSANR